MKHFRLRRIPNLLKRVFQRVVVVCLSILAQIIFFILLLAHFKEEFPIVYALLVLISAAATLVIISRNTNPAYKIAWVIPILIFPVFGGMFYLMLGGNRLSKRQRTKLQSVEKNLRRHLPQNAEIVYALDATSPQASVQCGYLRSVAGCPVYRDTETVYYPSGEEALQAMLEAIRSAEKYIFLEYFIIGPGLMWDSILEILKDKAAAGLDVRVMYDDFGSIKLLPVGYKKELEGYGIRCCVFEPFIPIMSARLNNRDHRKFLIVDGRIGFTGGINLADEYINALPRFGHWKDNAIRLTGDAVWSMTVMFLSLWDYVSGSGDTISGFLPPPHETQGQGFIQPYTDNPMDDNPVGYSVYSNLINRALRSIYIMTPYLIIDYSLTEALCNAAKTGLDVRIITPHIPDKKYVHAVTRANYEELVRCGVKIYEYTPGFIHSKVFLVDGEYATVGTVNLDFRSLYLHFENGVFMYRPDCLEAITRDFEETFRVSELMTLEKCRTKHPAVRLVRALLRLVAPLM